MRIYLDTNIYSLFKNEEFESLHSSVIADKLNNIYFFSEAHLYDLARDVTEEKFADMKLMEQVCGCNCYFFDKHIQYNFFTPRQYYDRFDWTPVTLQGDVDFLEPISLMLKLIPIRIGDYIKKEQLPEDYPKAFIDLLNQSTNLYEFINGFMDFAENLTNEQIKFREFLKYLHKNSLASKIYSDIGIVGFDGNKITDRKAFKDSYTDYCYKSSTQKDIYNVFMLMYNSLELLGLVRGKPRKQKMMNLINDARHAYFGSFCDIVVSRDEDFINKCSFLYSVLGIDNIVCTTDTFLKIVSDKEMFPSSSKDLLIAIKNMSKGDIAKMKDKDDQDIYVQNLQHIHYGYFDTLTFEPHKQLNKFIFSKQRVSFSLKAVQPELEFLTDRLVNEFGPDQNNLSIFDPQEIKAGDWSGRQWVMNEMLFELIYQDKLFIRISFLNKEGFKNRLRIFIIQFRERLKSWWYWIVG